MNATNGNLLLDIVKRLQRRIQLNQRVTETLDELSGNIRTNAGWFDKPDKVQGFIHKYREYLESYSSIIHKILTQIENEITNDHIHSLRKIANRNEMELQRCFQFQRFSIARGANHPKAKPTLQRVYIIIRDRIDADKDLGALIADMLRFVQSMDEATPSEQPTQSAQNGPRRALRSKDESDESTGEKAYKIFIGYLVRTNLGRAIAFAAFVCIGIAFAMNYTQRGPGIVDSIIEGEFEKGAIESSDNSFSIQRDARPLDTFPATSLIATPSQESAK